MPYNTNDELPPRVKDNIPSKGGKDLFREVFNSATADGKSETVSFASAWAALQDAGYEQNDSGKWVKKESPSPSDVHVPNTGRRKKPSRKVESYELPKGARDNARKVLRWREEHGDEVNGMTEVGWRRARQLAENETVGAETVKAMAQFNRHRSNSEIAPEYEGEPWRDAGYVAWLGWGGDVGIDWAIRQSERMEKSAISPDVFTERRAAEVRALDLGIEGSHVYEVNGQAYFMPGRNHEEYLEAYGQSMLEGQEKKWFERAIYAILGAVMLKTPIYRDEPVVRTGFMKIDQDQRIAWGWASVISEKGEPVFDTQGDAISADVLMNAANDFMSDIRAGHVMHEGVTKATVIHSLPLTKELADAFGISVDKEGWVIGMKIHDDETWQKVKAGEYGAFSIGGEAIRNAAG